ncbi:MAG: HAMP domain-containing histidine kinase [Bacteroidales bacterium]|nr:HAMP domain-containing histidine kinase [Bacteroidales bacterium]
MHKFVTYFLIHFWLSASIASGALPDSMKHVLYINSYHQGESWSDSIARGIKSLLNRQNGVELYIENFDRLRFADSLYASEFSSFLAKKYGKRIPHLFLASDDAAALMLLNLRTKMHSDRPAVVCGINNQEFYSGFENVFGIIETYPIDSTLGSLLRVFPDIRRVWVVSDSSLSSLQIRKEIAEQARAFAGNPEVSFLPVFHPDSILAFVRTLSKGDAVFVINIRIYQERNIDFQAFLRKLTEICPVPVFCNSSDALGTGIIGSRITRGFTHGRDAAKLALQILQKPDEKLRQHWQNPNMEYIFDYKVIKRFGYRIEHLPPGSILLNKPSDVWKKYRKIIFIGGAIASFLLAVILILSFNIKRRIHAEQVIRAQMEEIEKKSRSLQEALSALQLSHKQLETANEQLTELTLSLEEAREKAEESDHLKSAFLANISHEIRTPLNAILGFSTLVQKENKNDPRFSAYFSIIRKAGDNLLCLIDKILLVAKIESGQVTISRQKFPLNALFRQVAGEIRSRFSEKELNLVFTPSEEQEDASILCGDRELLRIVLTELLDNACRFSEGNEVRCTATWKPDGMVSFQVEDNGTGIPVEKQKYLFHRFYKMESENKFYPGTGLGLFIVKSLVELLGGTVSFYSESGKGTTFQMNIPAEPV